MGLTLPFVRDAVAAGEPVLVIVGEDRIRLLRSALGGAAERVMFTDMGDLGRNPARIIPEWREFVGRHAGLGRAMRGVGEPVSPGRDADELAECHRHEALLNLAFESAPSFWLLCTYDAAALDREVLEEARRTHPLVWEDGSHVRNSDYEDERSRLAFDGELAEPAGDVAVLTFDGGKLDRVRSFVWERARENGLAARAAGDLVLAASELASNSVRFGGGGGEIGVWAERGAVRCEVADAGRIADPLAGRAHPRVEQLDGRGLWLVNQICDLVQIRSSEAGTVVRLSMRLG